MRKRKVDVVLVWRYDRFARSTQALINALNEFRSLGVDFISFQEGKCLRVGARWRIYEAAWGVFEPDPANGARPSLVCLFLSRTPA